MFKKYCFLFIVFSIVFSNICNAEKSNTMRTLFGVVKVKDWPPDTIFLKDKAVYRAEGWYISLYNIFHFPDKEIILFGLDGGGNYFHCDDLKFLVIDKNQKTKIVEDNQFKSSDGTSKVQFKSGKVIIDLGFEEGKSKKAIFDGKTLTILLVRNEIIGSLSKEDCEWLYDFALDGCIFAKERNPTCDKFESTFSMFLIRGIGAISQNPAFDHSKFSEMCNSICETGRAPRFEPFKENFCNIKNKPSIR